MSAQRRLFLLIAAGGSLTCSSCNHAGPIAEQYQETANRIITTTLAGNDAYRKLEELCDGIGHRLSGSPALTQAVRWAAETLKRDGMANVRLEQVMVPHWVRGQESLALLRPRREVLPMLGLGGSVATPPGGITAEVVVVSDEEELEALGEGARGKIVLFNNPMPPYDPEHGAQYGTTVRFRSKGARLASQYGAVACLIRSVTAHSLRSPHTGAMNYGDAKVKIPAAAITTEDAAMMDRLQARGVPVHVSLKMEASMRSPARSANIIGELPGTTFPSEIVVIGGHIDSWDVGTGAHDDGTGCVMAMEAVNVLRKLNLTPKRTIRVVLWTNEENGRAGGDQYPKDHKDELANHIAAIESDSGGFRPIGYSVECKDEQRQQIAAEQLRDLLSLLKPLGADELETGFSGVDVRPLRDAGVIAMGHRVEGSTYFNYHHSLADTVDKVDPEDLSRNVAVMATVAYILADMPDRLGERSKEP